MHILIMLAVTGIQWLSPSGDRAAVTAADRSALSVVTCSGEAVFSLDGEPGETFAYPRLHGTRLVCVSSYRGILETDILTGHTSIVASGRTGAPWIDSGGNLWYTRAGSLFMGTELIRDDLQAFHVSVEDGYAAYTDADDYLRILNLQTGSERVFHDYRFYSPAVLTGGGALSPVLSGEIVHILPDGELSVVANGEQPVWSEELQGIFFTVTSDDGHRLTGADVWFVRPGEVPVRITCTPEVYEVDPGFSGGFLWYRDARTGNTGVLEGNALPF